jgi:hypothetical protein
MIIHGFRSDRDSRGLVTAQIEVVEAVEEGGGGAVLQLFVMGL